MGDDSGLTRHQVRLDLPEGRIEAEVALPAGEITLAELAYSVVDLASLVAQMAEAGAARAGYAISCSKGCAACCRQMVPVSPAEAFMLAELVSQSPEPRRSALRARFDAARRRITEAGLESDIERLRDPRLSAEAHTDIARRYFALGIACPFLEDEVCSLYDERPAMCREYAVVTPPALCQDPFDNAVKRVPLSVRFSEALARCGSDCLGVPAELVPLTLAAGWAASRREAGARTAAGATLLQSLTGHLAEAGARSAKR